MEILVMLENDDDMLNLNFTDLGFEVGFGRDNLFDVRISLTEVVLIDKKFGTMDLKVRNAPQCGHDGSR
jgi:hypothetical protein